MEYLFETENAQLYVINTSSVWLYTQSCIITLFLATFVLIIIKISFEIILERCIVSSEKHFYNANLVSKAEIIPTLPSVPIVGPLYPLIWKDFGKLFTFWMSNYGTTFQSSILGRNVVFLSDPKYLHKLLTSTEPGHLLKYPAVYHNLFPGVMKTGLIATSNIPDWKHNRSILSKAFSLESLKAYITVCNRHAKKLITDMHDELELKIRDKCEKHENDTKSLHAMLRESTFNSSTEIIVGANTLSEEDKLKVHDKFARCQDIISYRYYHPWCLVDFIWKFHPQKKEMDELINSLTQIFSKVFNDGGEKMDEEKSVKSFVDYMVAAGLDSTQIFAEVSNSFVAGYDTVKISLDYFLFNMALHQKYQEECRKEIDEMFYSLSGSGGDITFEALSEMKYLEMCIKESLRIFTPVPVFLRELATSLQLDGNVVLGKGTLVFVSPGLIHRDPDIYPDPVTYDPDRFLPENCRARSGYSFLAFSSGPRNCIGGKLAMIQIKLLASHILRHYEVYTENSYENLSKIWNKSIWPTKDLGVRWRKCTNII